MDSLNRTQISDVEKLQWEATMHAPVTVLQIGEGNFLRGFFDWMIHVCRIQGLFQGSIALVQPRPTGKAKIQLLADQDGLYTLVTRGLEQESRVERREVIAVFSQVFDPYTQWKRLIDIAVSPELRFMVSNTTEAGMVYRPEQYTDEPIQSFPGKMCYLLYARYQAHRGASDKGLICLPCELVERNGDMLRDTILRYAQDWELPVAFQHWVITHNRFLNSLVDRIVTGYPEEEQAESYFSEWGYRDEMLDTAEPYYLWAIEAEPELDHLLPFQQAGLNVYWTDDLARFQQRKVRILNGAHTWMALLGLLHGIEHVRELLVHPQLGRQVRELVLQEIVPTLPYAKADMLEYASEVFDRYANPYLNHRLHDIAMNSVSKFKVRLLPTLSWYAERGEPFPEGLINGCVGFIRYYQIRLDQDGTYIGVTLNGATYTVRDDLHALAKFAEIWAVADTYSYSLEHTVRTILSDHSLWGEDVSAWPGFTEAIVQRWAHWEVSKNNT